MNKTKREQVDSLVKEINIIHDFEESLDIIKESYCKLLKVDNINTLDLIRLLEEKKYIKQHKMLKSLYYYREISEGYRNYRKTL